MSIVEDTERTQFCPQTDRRTDGQTDKVIPVYLPINFVEAGGIITPENFMMIQSWEHSEQDRRWNADKPSAALDPYIPT